MGADKHTLQKWVAGAEVRFKKNRRPLESIPLLNKLRPLAQVEQAYVLTEKIDLTRARNFQAQQTTEDILFASIQLPVLGKKGIGNDTGMAVAGFDYQDTEGEVHHVIAICAYTVSGVASKERTLKQVIAIPMS